MKKISVITNDTWWDTDITIFPKMSRYFKINVFVVSFKHYEKKYPIKSSDHLEVLNEYERQNRLTNLKNIFFVLKILKDFRTQHNNCDGVIYEFGDDPYFNFFFLFYCRTKKTIISFHNYIEHSDNPFFEKIFKRIYLAVFKNFHFHSQLQYKQFFKKHADKNSFFTDMPLKDFGEAKSKIEIRKKGKKVFLFFGYIREYKRVELFIEAANDTGPGLHFVIAGNCSNWAQYDRLILNKEKFTCNIKFIDNAEIADYFTQADFLVLPYSDSTQSGPLHIANNYNLPIIASDLETFTDVIKNGYNGFIFKQGDSKDLKRCMHRACNLSNEEYFKLKENQKEMQRRYALDSDGIGEKFNTFIEAHLR